jgi:two-component system, NarL family, response regulator LiaR
MTCSPSDRPPGVIPGAAASFEPTVRSIGSMTNTNPTEHGPINVALVNDFELVLRGTERMLGQFPDRLVVSELNIASNPDHRVDVALFDTYGHARGGVDRVRSLATDPRVGTVAVYTWRLPPGQVEALLTAGAGGVLAKSLPAAVLVDSLIAIHRGETVVSPMFRRPRELSWPGHEFGLTARESDVAAFLAKGCSNREIADALFVSEHTVKTHLKSIFRKTGVASRAGAAVRIAEDADFRRRTVA